MECWSVGVLECWSWLALLHYSITSLLPPSLGKREHTAFLFTVPGAGEGQDNSARNRLQPAPK
jgi:hypothetical protein